MKTAVVAFVTVLLLASELPLGLTFPSTSPAFLWSSHQDGLTNDRVQEAVSYQTLSTKDLAKSVMSEGGWSNLLCSGLESQQSIDLALLFVGRESLDISGNKHGDRALVDLLKASFTKSNFSLAFPYVATSEEKEPMESSLVSEFAGSCGQDFGLRNVAILEACAAMGENFEKLADVHAIPAFLDSTRKKSFNGQTNLIVVCHEGPDSMTELRELRPESQVLSELISSVEETGAKYSVLYVSDPFSSIRYPSYRQLERFLAEGSFGNASANSTTCDEVCQIKSSLLEGLLVGLVLLIILISGLCCMMGIDTPTRFEAPIDS